MILLAAGGPPPIFTQKKNLFGGVIMKLLCYSSGNPGPLQVTERLRENLPSLAELADKESPYKSAARAALREVIPIAAAHNHAETLYNQWIDTREYGPDDVRRGVVRAIRETALPLSRIYRKKARAKSLAVLRKFTFLEDRDECAEAAEELGYRLNSWRGDVSAYGDLLIEAWFLSRLFAPDLRSYERATLEMIAPRLPNFQVREDLRRRYANADPGPVPYVVYDALFSQARLKLPELKDNEELAQYLLYLAGLAGSRLRRWDPLRADGKEESGAEDNQAYSLRATVWLELNCGVRYAVRRHATAMDKLYALLKLWWMAIALRRSAAAGEYPPLLSPDFP
jgi:hypothetical protein